MKRAALNYQFFYWILEGFLRLLSNGFRLYIFKGLHVTTGYFMNSFNELNFMVDVREANLVPRWQRLIFQFTRGYRTMASSIFKQKTVESSVQFSEHVLIKFSFLQKKIIKIYWKKTIIKEKRRGSLKINIKRSKN